MADIKTEENDFKSYTQYCRAKRSVSAYVTSGQILPFVFTEKNITIFNLLHDI